MTDIQRYDQIAMLKDELNCAEGEYENLKNKCNRLQARVDELEKKIAGLEVVRDGLLRDYLETLDEVAKLEKGDG